MEALFIAGKFAKERWSADRDRYRANLLSLAVIAICSVLLVADNAFAQFDDGKYTTVCQNAMKYLEGDFGALLTALAGIGAIVASAVGGFKVAWSLLVVAVGAFILREFIIGGGDSTVGFFAGKC